MKLLPILLFCGLASFLSFDIKAEAPAPVDPSKPPPKVRKSDASAAFFADPTVRTFELEIGDEELASIRRSPRTYVRGNLQEGTQVFTNIGIHLKGMGSFQPLEQKPSFVLKFDKFEPSRNYHGLDRLMLNNSIQDQTYMAELLATGLFRDAGVPAAHVTHARVRLNGRNLGLYVAIEAMNKGFLKRNFHDSSGNLYEGYLRDINGRLDQDNGSETSQRDVRTLFAACQVPDLTERFQRLNKLLDVDRFASFAAMEMLIAHWDGYTLHTNNYRFYHDPGSDKMVFIAHGLDAVFYRPNVPIQPPMRSIVSRALFETLEGRQAYEQRLRTLYTNVFRLDVITNRMADALAKLKAAKLSAIELESIERKASKLSDRIAHRRQRVGEQLQGISPRPLSFDDSSLARANDWRDESDSGKPLHDRVQTENRATLHIRAPDGRCRASWRAMIFLQPGRYRFEGVVRTENVNGPGVAVRISGDTRYTRLTGTNPWQPIQHEFTVKEQDSGDIELVCELNALSGEVWFDLGSLQVRRL